MDSSFAIDDGMVRHVDDEPFYLVFPRQKPQGTLSQSWMNASFFNIELPNSVCVNLRTCHPASVLEPKDKSNDPSLGFRYLCDRLRIVIQRRTVLSNRKISQQAPGDGAGQMAVPRNMLSNRR